MYRWKDQQEQLSSGSALAEDERVEFQRLRKENKELRMEKEILKRPVPSDERNEVKYRFVKTHAQSHSVRMLCPVMKVSKSAFYAWQEHPAQLITAQDLKMYRRVKALLKASKERLGSREMAKKLRLEGFAVTRYKITK